MEPVQGPVSSPLVEVTPDGALGWEVQSASAFFPSGRPEMELTRGPRRSGARKRRSGVVNIDWGSIRSCNAIVWSMLAWLEG